MTENTLNTPVPTKPAESLTKKILLIPFRLVGFVIKWSVIIVLVAFVVILAAGLIRAAYPMNLPEAKGMTYYELMEDRWEADIAVRGYFWDLEDLKISPIIINIVMYPGIIINTTIPAVIAVFEPGGKAARALKAGNSQHAFVTPRGEAKWTNIPALVWEAIERSTWQWFVMDEPKLPLPQPKEH